MFKIKEDAMGYVARGGNDHDLYIGNFLDVLRIFIKHRFPAVGRFGKVVFGLVLGWVVSAYFDGTFRPNTPPPHTHTHTRTHSIFL